jgi:hypothetical protein
MDQSPTVQMLLLGWTVLVLWNATALVEAATTAAAFVRPPQSKRLGRCFQKSPFQYACSTLFSRTQHCIMLSTSDNESCAPETLESSREEFSSYPSQSTENPTSRSSSSSSSSSSSTTGIGDYNPGEGIEVRNPEKLNVGNPQLQVAEREFSVNAILKELAAIQQQGPQKYCILGTRHCSFLHQQIIELLYVL